MAGKVRAWLGISHTELDMELEREDFETVEAQLWEMSPERRWYFKRRRLGFAGATAGLVLLMVAGLVGQPPRSEAEEWWALILAALGFVSLGYSTFPYWAARLAFNERRRKMAGYVASDTLREIRNRDDIPLHLLFAYNRRQLDAYQEEGRNQQRLAFRYALLTSALGFAVLLVGIAVSFRAGPGTEAFVAAGLSTVGAALSAYVAATMLRISRQADARLNRFYMEPHMMGRLLMAERLLDSEGQAATVAHTDAMIKQVLSWPLPGQSEPDPMENPQP